MILEKPKKEMKTVLKELKKKKIPDKQEKKMVLGKQDKKIVWDQSLQFFGVQKIMVTIKAIFVIGVFCTKTQYM